MKWVSHYLTCSECPYALWHHKLMSPVVQFFRDSALSRSCVFLLTLSSAEGSSKVWTNKLVNALHAEAPCMLFKGSFMNKKSIPQEYLMEGPPFLICMKLWVRALHTSVWDFLVSSLCDFECFGALQTWVLECSTFVEHSFRVRVGFCYTGIGDSVLPTPLKRGAELSEVGKQD